MGFDAGFACNCCVYFVYFYFVYLCVSMGYRFEDESQRRRGRM